MPNVKTLIADQGVTFDNSFVSYSLCCPSRSTFLTGQYAHNHGVWGNAAPNGGYYKLDSTNTLPVWLQRAGYQTIHLGKYLNQYGTRNPTRDPARLGPVVRHARSVHLPLPELHRSTRTGTSSSSATPPPTTRPTSSRGSRSTSSRARPPIRARSSCGSPSSRRIAATRVTRTTRAASRRRRPLPRHKNRFANEPLPMPPSFNEADVSDKPAAIRNRPLLTSGQDQRRSARTTSSGSSRCSRSTRRSRRS